MSASKDNQKEVKKAEAKPEAAPEETSEKAAPVAAKIEKTPESKEAVAPVKKIPEHQFKQAEYARNVWRSTPAHGVAFEEILKPEYWTHIAKKVKRGDIIEAFAEDGSYYAELFVTNSADQWVTVVQIGHMDLAVKAKIKRPDYEVKWRGDQALWSIIRTKDGQLMQDKLPTESQAEEWIRQHLKILAA